MTSILFVDDDPNIGAGLKRTLRSMRESWSTRFAQSGAEALAILADGPTDVITDMQMPGILPKRAVEEAFTAGLLHDIGVLVLTTLLGDVEREIAQQCGEGHASRCELERARLGATHAEIGGYLLALWGLPDSIVEATTFHHRPRDADQPMPILTAVHVASALTGSDPAQVDIDYLRLVGLESRVDSWKAHLAAEATRHA